MDQFIPSSGQKPNCAHWSIPILYMRVRKWTVLTKSATVCVFLNWLLILLWEYILPMVVWNFITWGKWDKIMKYIFKIMHKCYLPKSKYYTKGFFNINTIILIIFFKILTLKNEIIMLVNGFKKQYQQEECIWCKGD